MGKKRKKETSVVVEKEQDEELKEWVSEKKGGFNTPFASLKDLLKTSK